MSQLYGAVEAKLQLLEDLTKDDQMDARSSCTYKIAATKHCIKVLVISVSHDSNFHHLLVVSLSRLVRLVPFLRENKDVMVHIRGWEEFESVRPLSPGERFAAKKQRAMLLELLGVPASRIVTGRVTADYVFVPRGMTWADVLKNPAEVRLLARQLIEGIRNEVKRLQRNPPDLKAPSTSNVKDLFPKETKFRPCRTKSMTAK